jgi:hypothetical protein
MSVLARTYDWGLGAAWCVAALCIPIYLYIVIFIAPDAQRAAQQQKEASMWRESAAFCEKYGSAAASARHADCVRDLMDMRAKDKRRFAAELDDIFF